MEYQNGIVGLLRWYWGIVVDSFHGSAELDFGSLACQLS